MSSTRGPDIAPVVTNVPGIAVTRSQSSIPAASVTPVALRQPSAPVPAKHVPASASTPVKFTFNVTASPATFNHMLVQQPSREFMRTVEPVSIEMPSTQPESPQPFATPSRTAGAASPFNAFVSQQRDTMSRASYAALPTAESVLAEVPPSPAVPLLNLSKTPIDQFVPSSARESPSLSPPPTAIAHAAFAQKSARRVVVSPPPSSSLLPPPNANATPRRSGASLASTAAAVFGASPHTAVIQDFPSGIGPQAIGRAAFKSSHIAASPSPRRQATNQMSTSLLSAGAMTGAVAAGAESIIATKHAARAALAIEMRLMEYWPELLEGAPPSSNQIDEEKTNLVLSLIEQLAISCLDATAKRLFLRMWPVVATSIFSPIASPAAVAAGVSLSDLSTDQPENAPPSQTNEESTALEGSIVVKPSAPNRPISAASVASPRRRPISGREISDSIDVDDTPVSQRSAIAFHDTATPSTAQPAEIPEIDMDLHGTQTSIKRMFSSGVAARMVASQKADGESKLYQRLTQRPRIAYSRVANELHSVLINARSEQEKLERAVESAVEREQNLKIQVDALNGLLERMTLRVDVLERADKQWQEKYEELVENTRQERADMDRLVEECAEFRELAARARAAYAPGGEISVMRDRVRALELELKDAQQLAKSMRLQAEQTAAQMKAIREDRDDLRTRCAVQDQAIKVMSAQLKDDSDEDDSQPDADAKGDADDAESQHSDSTEASNEDASSKKEDGETKSEKSGSDDSGDDDDDEPNEWDGRSCNPFDDITEEELDFVVHDRVFPKAEKGFFIGRGVGNEIPVFLRHEGKLKFYEIEKGLVEDLVKKIWELKKHSDAERRNLGLRIKPLDEFFHEYVCWKFKNGIDIMEFSHSYTTALKMYSWDADCELFFGILFRELSEATYHDQMNFMDAFKDALYRWQQLDQRGRALGQLDVDILLSGLRNFFPRKSEEFMQVLRDLSYGEYLVKGTNRVDLAAVLFENDDGDQSSFMEAVREQYMVELTTFSQDIYAALNNADIDKKGNIPAGQVEAIIKELDPLKPQDEVRDYMTRGLGQPMISHDQAVDLEKFYRNLRENDIVCKTGHYVANAQPAANVLYAVSSRENERNKRGGVID